MSKPRNASTDMRRWVVVVAAGVEIDVMDQDGNNDYGKGSDVSSMELFPEVEADQGVLAASVETTVGEGRVGADLVGKDLGASSYAESVRGSRGADEFAALGEHQ